MAQRFQHNALLARPPELVHSLGHTGGAFFRRTVGRPVRPEDYHGVHTTGSKDIAGVYAMGAWSSIKDQEPDAYPAILTLDVSGLSPMPDVDAVVEAVNVLGDLSVRSQFEGVSLDEANDVWEPESDFLRLGADVNSAVMEAMWQGPAVAFEDDDSWERWVEDGYYTDENAIRLVDQRRYMADFGLDRLVKAEAMKPWWPELMEEPYDEDSEAALEAVEEAGYVPVLINDIYSGLLDLKTIARGSGAGGDVQYHGTSSWHLQRAFPELRVPADPFSLQGVRGLKGRLLR